MLMTDAKIISIFKVGVKSGVKLHFFNEKNS